MIRLTASTALFFTIATLNATTTTREALAAPESCDPDKIDNLETIKNCQATGEIGQDACYAEDIDGNVVIDQPCQIISDGPAPWDLQLHCHTTIASGSIAHYIVFVTFVIHVIEVIRVICIILIM
jgi:hypothetical protein